MTTIFAVALLCSVCVFSAMGQSKIKGSSNSCERERIGRRVDSGERIEEFRREYLNYSTYLEDNRFLITEFYLRNQISCC